MIQARKNYKNERTRRKEKTHKRKNVRKKNLRDGITSNGNIAQNGLAYV